MRIKGVSFFHRICALLLSLALAAPNSAFALRTQNTESKLVEVGLEEALSGLEEINLNQEDLNHLKQQLRQAFSKQILSDGAIKGVIARRRQEGSFTDLNQLAEIPGIGPGNLPQIRSRLSLGETPVPAVKPIPFTTTVVSLSMPSPQSLPAVGSPVGSFIITSADARVPPRTSTIVLRPVVPQPLNPNRFSISVTPGNPKSMSFQVQGTGPRIIPGRHQRPRIDPPPEALPYDPKRQQAFETLLSLMDDAARAVRQTSRVDFRPIKAHLQSNQQLYGGFNPVLPDQGGSTDYNPFRRSVEWNLAPRCGEVISLSGPGDQIRFRKEGPWEGIPYLAGFSTWLAKGKRIKGTAAGSARLYAGVYDPDATRHDVSQRYEELTKRGPGLGRTYTQAEFQRIMPSIHQKEELFFQYFGELPGRIEETQHARLDLWGALFNGQDLLQEALIFPLSVEAAMRPHSYVDTRIWDSAKKKIVFGGRINRGDNQRNLITWAEIFHELEGQLSRLLAVMEMVSQEPGIPQEERDQWIYGLFLDYLLGIEKHTAVFEGVKHYPEKLSERIYSYFLRRGLSSDVELIQYLNQPESDGQTPIPGQRSMRLMRELYEDIFLNDTERAQLLTATAGLEEQGDTYGVTASIKMWRWGAGPTRRAVVEQYGTPAWKQIRPKILSLVQGMGRNGIDYRPMLQQAIPNLTPAVTEGQLEKTLQMAHSIAQEGVDPSPFLQMFVVPATRLGMLQAIEDLVISLKGKKETLGNVLQHGFYALREVRTPRQFAAAVTFLKKLAGAASAKEWQPLSSQLSHGALEPIRAEIMGIDYRIKIEHDRSLARPAIRLIYSGKTEPAQGTGPRELELPIRWDDPAELERKLEALEKSFALIWSQAKKSDKARDLHPLVKQACNINPEFITTLPEQALRDPAPKDLYQFTLELIWQVFLPAEHSMGLGFGKDGNARMAILVRAGPWDREEYLSKLILWKAPIRWLRGSQHVVGEAFGHLALAEEQAVRKEAQENYQRLFAQDFSSDPIQGRLQALIRQLNISEEEFCRLEVQAARFEERQHAKDASFSGASAGRDFRMDPERSITTVEEILEPSSFMRGPFWPLARPDWSAQIVDKAGSIFECSGKLGGLISQMEVLLRNGRPQDAYAVFLMRLLNIRLELEPQPGESLQRGQYALEAQYFLKALVEAGILSEAEILPLFPSVTGQMTDPAFQLSDNHANDLAVIWLEQVERQKISMQDRAERALENLQAIFRRNFKDDNKRKDILLARQTAGQEETATARFQDSMTGLEEKSLKDFIQAEIRTRIPDVAGNLTDRHWERLAQAATRPAVKGILSGVVEKKKLLSASSAALKAIQTAQKKWQDYQKREKEKALKEEKPQEPRKTEEPQVPSMRQPMPGSGGVTVTSADIERAMQELNRTSGQGQAPPAVFTPILPQEQRRRREEAQRRTRQEAPEVIGWNDKVQQVVEAVASNPNQGGMLLRLQNHGSRPDAQKALRFVDEILARGISPERLLVVEEIGAPTLQQLYDALAADPQHFFSALTEQDFLCNPEIFADIQDYYSGGETRPLPVDHIIRDTRYRYAFSRYYSINAPNMISIYRSKRQANPESKIFPDALSRGLADRGVDEEWEDPPVSSWLLMLLSNGADSFASSHLFGRGQEQEFLSWYRRSLDAYGWMQKERDDAMSAWLKNLMSRLENRNRLILVVRGAQHIGLDTLMGDYGGQLHAVSFGVARGAQNRLGVSRFQENRMGQPWSAEQEQRALKEGILSRMIELLQRSTAQLDRDRLMEAYLALEQGIPDADARRLNRQVYELRLQPESAWFTRLPPQQQILLECYFIFAWLNDHKLIPEEYKTLFPSDAQDVTLAHWAEKAQAALHSAGLEEQMDWVAAVIKETMQGRNAVVIDGAVFQQMAGLEELLKRLPAHEDRIVVVGVPSAVKERISARNTGIRWADTPADAVPLLLSAEAVDVLGSIKLLQAIQTGLAGFAIRVSALDQRLGLKVLLIALGVPEEILKQIDWTSVETALRTLEAA